MPIQLNIHEAKTHLSKYLADLHEGETIVLCRRNAPIAEIRSLAVRDGEARPIGLGKEVFSVPDAFFESLPDQTRMAFEGR